MASSLRLRVVLLALAATSGALVVSGCGAEKPGSQAPAAPRSTLPGAEAATTSASCEPTGAHPKHRTYACTTCHLTKGTLCFDPAGPATGALLPPPAFDATAKTCSNVACHAVPAGTFTYYFPGGDGEPELRTAPYGGGGAPTPSWYATGLGCSSCHDLTYGGTRYVWHSGRHAGTSATTNACQLCHLDATGTATSTGPSAGSAIVPAYASYHANGAVNVTPKFKSSCFGCH